MRIIFGRAAGTVALGFTVLMAGCVTMPGLSSSESKSAEPKATAAAPSSIPPGMNAAGEVVDSSKVEEGHGQKVKGLNDWEGEITGKPAPGSKFTQLKIGMDVKQCEDIVGQPTDQGAYTTGKAWIPFFFGADRYRTELVYKNMGRLIFAGSGGFDSSAHLIWVINNAHEPGYR